MDNIDIIVRAVKDYIQRCMTPLGERLKVLEARGAPAPGERGEKGEPGPAGKDGAAGAPGAQGERGEPGERGEKGEQGAPGASGKDGAPGEPGPRGEKGDRGERGEKGEPGEPGAPGEKGADGLNGKDGALGEKGLDGRDGLEGPPGRDAFQIEVLDVIDPQKRYPRGTYAYHRGGTVRAFKTTEPLGEGDMERFGWQVMVRGIDAVEIGQDEAAPGLISLGLRMTDGTLVHKQMRMPVLIYRGIWKEEEVYHSGDAATWAGSLWIAQAQETTSKPDAGDGGWRLAVKRGRDGRDGKDGTPGERGAQGERGVPGRDGRHQA